MLVRSAVQALGGPKASTRKTENTEYHDHDPYHSRSREIGPHAGSLAVADVAWPVSLAVDDPQDVKKNCNIV
jgi:hypothetical protein